MRILVFGDIHGRSIWKKILEVEKDIDRVVFLGDYVSSHDGISEEDQLKNLYEILEYKEENPDDVILLRGNHDTQHLGYYWAECSGLFPKVLREMSADRDRFLRDTQWIYLKGRLLFSHAGVSEEWLENIGLSKVEDINSLSPSENFGFWPGTPRDYDGSSSTQPCTWIRPWALERCGLPGYTHIVGHTPITYQLLKGQMKEFDLVLCDALGIGQWLVIEDTGKYFVHSFSNNNEEVKKIIAGEVRFY